MFSLDVPTTTDSLVTGLKGQRREISYFFGALSVEEFFAPQGDHWSPAGHLRHLAKSVRPLAAVVARLDDLYPDDRVVGYGLGDFRGAVSVKLRLE